MNIHTHCSLCENAKPSLQHGMLCGLTDKKPAFNKKCLDIRLGQMFEHKLGLILIEIEQLRKQRISVYLHSFTGMLLGGILILSNKHYFVDFEFTYSYYKGSIGYLGLILLGFGLISLSYNKLLQYIKKTSKVKNEKDSIDAVLNKYLIEYSCSVEFSATYHGKQNAIIALKSNSNLLKNSINTFQI